LADRQKGSIAASRCLRTNTPNGPSELNAAISPTEEELALLRGSPGQKRAVRAAALPYPLNVRLSHENFSSEVRTDEKTLSASDSLSTAQMAARRGAVVFGFDSAWMDNPNAPGAICAIGFDEKARPRFVVPQLVGFKEALAFIDAERRGHQLCLVALDQPSIVPNSTGGRPAERVAGSVISFSGGGVQPANRGKAAMFGDAAPVWRFLEALGALQDPMTVPEAETGLFLIEVFPALALPGFDPAFAGRLGAPKYNPDKCRKFRIGDWQAVTTTVARVATTLDIAPMVHWSESMAAIERPSKADQDRLDAAICALVGLIWRDGSWPAAMIGTVEHGFIIAPVSEPTWARMEWAARERRVPIVLRQTTSEM
jgi:predicted RNase H-like nuclease